MYCDIEVGTISYTTAQTITYLRTPVPQLDDLIPHHFCDRDPSQQLSEISQNLSVNFPRCAPLHKIDTKS